MNNKKKKEKNEKNETKLKTKNISIEDKFTSIKNVDAIIKEMLDECKYEDESISRSHEFTMLLDERFYEPFDAWIRVRL